MAPQQQPPASPVPGADAATAAFIQAIMGGLSTGNASILSSVWAATVGDDTTVTQKYTPPANTNKRAYLPGGAPNEVSQAFAARTTGTLEDLTASDIFNEIYEISQSDPGDWDKIQRELYLGGFYGDRDLEDINFGEIDDLDVSAINEVLTWTARQNAALMAKGEKGTVTWRDVLDRYAKQRIGPAMEAAAKARDRAAKTVVLSDPKGLAQGLDQMAQNILGRKATADEKKVFVATFHAMQSSAQLAEGGTVVNPDAGGQAEALLRSRNSAEAGAHDMSNTFNDFLQIISGGFN